MNAHAFDLDFSAPLTELPTAPGLFGQLAWWVRYSEGERAVEGLIESFQASPPWRISSAFPKGRLPRPLLPPTDDPRLAESAFRKQLKRVRYLDFETFAEVLQGGERALLARLESAPDDTPPSRSVTRARVGIDRTHGGAFGGLLYTDTLEQPLGTWTVYVQAEQAAALAWLYKGLRFIGEGGYGGKVSVGLGRFSVSPPYETELPEAADADAFTTLSPCLVSHPRGFYELETHWGRLGGTFTHHETPFKRPYLRAGVGSTFYGEPSAEGLLVTAQVGEATVKDYLYPFPLGVRLEVPGE